MNYQQLLDKEKQKHEIIKTTAGTAVMLCIMSCVFMLALQIILAHIPFSSTNEILSSLYTIVTYVCYLSLPFLFLSLCFKHFFKKVDTQLYKRNSPKKPFLYITGTLGIGYLTNLIVVTLFSGFVEHHAVGESVVPETTVGIILLYISNAVLPAILEEWAFRGVICKNLLPYNKKGAIIVSSFLFGLMHINPATIIFTTIIGILLGICFSYTGSLKIPMLIHFLNNAIATTTSVFFSEQKESLLILIPTLLIFALLGLGITAIIYYSRKGISKTKISLIKSKAIEYKLSFRQFMSKAIINYGVIPLAFMYVLFYMLYYLF